MKKIFFLATIFSIFIFSSCKKESTGDEGASIRYEFTAILAGNYSFDVLTDTVAYNETVNTASWTKTVQVAAGSNGTDSAVFTVYPPVDWFGTTNESPVTLKIFVNNVEKASQSGLLMGADRPSGITVSTAY